MGTVNVLAETSMQQHRYQWLAQAIEEQIKSNCWPSGARLPSIRELSSEYGVSKNNVLSALNKLKLGD